MYYNPILLQKKKHVVELLENILNLHKLLYFLIKVVTVHQ